MNLHLDCFQCAGMCCTYCNWMSSMQRACLESYSHRIQWLSISTQLASCYTLYMCRGEP